MVLERFESTDEGTFGRLFVDEVLFSFTLELPWRDNATNFSSIPEGIYQCTWTLSSRFKKRMYLISKVTGRSGIRIHSANLAGDRDLGLRAQLNGCISFGESLGYLDGQKALLKSAPTVRRFESLMEGRPFTLEVRSDRAA